MVVPFLVGIIVGVLLGLAVAPVLHSWIAWQTAKSFSHEAPPPRHEPSATDRNRW